MIILIVVSEKGFRTAVWGLVVASWRLLGRLVKELSAMWKESKELKSEPAKLDLRPPAAQPYRSAPRPYRSALLDAPDGNKMKFTHDPAVGAGLSGLVPADEYTRRCIEERALEVASEEKQRRELE